MERLFSKKLYVPKNIIYSDMYELCKKFNVDCNPADKTRMFFLSSDEESNIRAVKIRLLLKEI